MVTDMHHRVAGLAGLCLLLITCTTGHYKQSADQETYAAIAGKATLVPGMIDQVDLGNADRESTAADIQQHLAAYPQNQNSFEFLDTSADSELGARVISLDAALELAFHYSKEYQTQKERLYLQALALTFDRYRYTPTFSFTASGDYEWDTKDQFVEDMQALTGMRNVSTSETVDATTSLGADFPIPCKCPSTDRQAGGQNHKNRH